MKLTDFTELGVKSWLELYEMISNMPATIRGEEEVRFQHARVKMLTLKDILSNKAVPKKKSDFRTYTVNLLKLKALCFDEIYPKLPTADEKRGISMQLGRITGDCLGFLQPLNRVPYRKP